MEVSSAVPASATTAGAKRHSPVFLGVFAVFLIATMICGAGAVLGVLSAVPSHHDTQWFWASGHLLAHGQNPYDREAISKIETSLGLHVNRHDIPMMRNPPPALFLVATIGMLPPRAAVVAWSLLLLAFLIVSVLATRSMLDGPYERNYLLLAWCFAPALCCIEMGQTGLIVLLGLALFLLFQEERPFWAGAALSLCAVKPHLLLPFGVVLLAWIVGRRRWLVLAGAVLALAVESGIPMFFDHAVWAHYFAAMRTENIVGEFVPTLGTGLRFLVDRGAMWVEFVPAALGCAWGLWYFLRNRERWNWRTHGSLLTLVSLVAAPYSFVTDQVIALPAILFVLLGPEKPRRRSLTLLLAIMSAGAVMMLMNTNLFFKPYLLEGVAWLAWYLYAVSGRAVRERDAAIAV